MIWCNVIFQFIHYRGKLTRPSRYHSGSSVLEGLESVTHPFPTAPPHHTTIIEIRS